MMTTRHSRREIRELLDGAGLKNPGYLVVRHGFLVVDTNVTIPGHEDRLAKAREVLDAAGIRYEVLEDMTCALLIEEG